MFICSRIKSSKSPRQWKFSNWPENGQTRTCCLKIFSDQCESKRIGEHCQSDSRVWQTAEYGWLHYLQAAFTRKEWLMTSDLLEPFLFSTDRRHVNISLLASLWRRVTMTSMCTMLLRTSNRIKLMYNESNFINTVVVAIEKDHQMVEDIQNINIENNVLREAQ